MEEKTKEELIEIIKEKDERIEELEGDLKEAQLENDKLSDENDELSEENEKLENQLDEQIGNEGIKSLENFIWKLKLDNLYTPELETFINDYYMRYHND